jgi:hypothetical protein
MPGYLLTSRAETDIRVGSSHVFEAQRLVGSDGIKTSSGDENSGPSLSLTSAAFERYLSRV